MLNKMQVIESAKIPCFIALILISNLCFFYAQVGVARNAMQRSLEEFVKCMAACVVCMCIRNPETGLYAKSAYFSKVYFSLKYFKIFKSRNLLREERLYIYFKTFDIQENTPIFTINPLLIH